MNQLNEKVNSVAREILVLSRNTLLVNLRFLDMAYRQRNDRIAKFKRRNLALYNRVVWGVLYHETFPQLRYGFTDEVRKAIRTQLQNSLNP